MKPGRGGGRKCGWMVCDWSMGLRRLFWVGNGGVDSLPAFCQRVRIVRERVWGQPGRVEEAGSYGAVVVDGIGWIWLGCVFQ